MRWNSLWDFKMFFFSTTRRIRCTCDVNWYYVRFCERQLPRHHSCVLRRGDVTKEKIALFWFGRWWLDRVKILWTKVGHFAEWWKNVIEFLNEFWLFRGCFCRILQTISDNSTTTTTPTIIADVISNPVICLQVGILLTSYLLSYSNCV